MPLEFLPSSIYLLQSREYRSETTSQAHRFKQSIAIQSATEPLKIHVCVISVDKLDDLEDLARRPMIRTDTRANSGVNNSEVCRLSVTSSQGRAVYGICGAHARYLRFKNWKSAHRSEARLGSPTSQLSSQYHNDPIRQQVNADGVSRCPVSVLCQAACKRAGRWFLQ